MRLIFILLALAVCQGATWARDDGRPARPLLKPLFDQLRSGQ
ncbi:hypothetical protein [Bradyrhizobium sp. WD16]|nr:hypothetical protein [Bradyrhizobium sp. WD16]